MKSMIVSKIKSMSSVLLLVLPFMGALQLSSSAVMASDQKSEMRELTPFEKIDISGAYKVVLVQGEKENILVEGDADDVAEVKTKVEQGTLKIYHDKKSFSSGKIKLTISFKNIKELECSGAVSLSSQNALNFKELELEFSGACSSDLDLTADKLDVDISGTGNAVLKGKANRVELDISGTGKFNAADLSASDYKIEISGVGSASVAASSKLDVTISGTGSVTYKGDPKIEKKISGMGSLKKSS